MLSNHNKENVQSSGLSRKTEPKKPRLSNSINPSVSQSFQRFDNSNGLVIAHTFNLRYDNQLAASSDGIVDTLYCNTEGSQQPLSEETKLPLSQNTNIEKFPFVAQTQFNEECEYIETEIRENDVKNDTSEGSEMEYNLGNFDGGMVQVEMNTPEKFVQIGNKKCKYCNQQLSGNAYSLDGRESDLIDLGLSTRWNENIDPELYLPIFPFDIQYRYQENVAYDIANEITTIQVEKEKELFLGQYLNNHTTITPKMRMCLIDWVFEFSSHQDCIEVFFISVQIIDHFLNKTPNYPPFVILSSCYIITFSNELQLLGASAVSLATKMERLQNYPIRYTWIRNILTLTEVYDFERTVLNTLSFDILFPTSFGFLQRVMLTFSQEDRNKTMIQSATVLFCLHSTYHFCKYPQQLLASSVLFYIRLYRQPKREAEFESYKNQKIQNELQQNGVISEQTTNFLERYKKRVAECWNESAASLMNYDSQTLYTIANEIHQCISFFLSSDSSPTYISSVAKEALSDLY